MRTLALIVGILAAGLIVGLSAMSAAAATTVSVSMTLTEPLVAGPIGNQSCPDIGLAVNCGSGEIRPFGHATEIVSIGACGDTCSFRWINLPSGTIVLKETVSDFSCPGACGSQWPHGAPFSAALGAVVVGGTGAFEGASGSLSGTLNATVWQAQVKYAGTIALAS